MFETFKNFGLNKKTIEILVGYDIKAIDEEPKEEELLINAIKNAPAEKKAQRDFE